MPINIDQIMKVYANALSGITKELLLEAFETVPENFQPDDILIIMENMRKSAGTWERSELTPTHIVVASGDTAWLTKHFQVGGVDRQKCALIPHMAIRMHNCDILKVILKEMPEAKTARRLMGHTLAHTAVEEGDLACLQEVLKSDSTNWFLHTTTTRHGNTIAHSAAQSRVDFFAYVLSLHHSFLITENKKGSTPEMVHYGKNVRPKLQAIWEKQLANNENIEIARQGLALLQANPSVEGTTDNAVKDNKRKVSDDVSVTASNTSRAIASISTTTASTSNGRLVIDLEPEEPQPNNKKLKVNPPPIIDTIALRAPLRDLGVPTELPKSLSEAEQIAALRAELAKSQQENENLRAHQKIMAKTIETLTQANHDLINVQPQISRVKTPDPANAALIARYSRSGAVGVATPLENIHHFDTQKTMRPVPTTSPKPS